MYCVVNSCKEGKKNVPNLALMNLAVSFILTLRRSFKTRKFMIQNNESVSLTLILSYNKMKIMHNTSAAKDYFLSPVMLLRELTGHCDKLMTIPVSLHHPSLPLSLALFLSFPTHFFPFFLIQFMTNSKPLLYSFLLPIYLPSLTFLHPFPYPVQDKSHTTPFVLFLFFLSHFFTLFPSSNSRQVPYHSLTHFFCPI